MRRRPSTIAMMWRERSRYALPLACCLAGSIAATYFVGLEIRNNVIWVANGLLVAYLLLAPRWRWSAYLVAGFAGQLAGSMLAGQHSWKINLTLSALNVAEAGLAAFLLRRRSAQLPQFADRGYVFRFLGLAVFTAPAILGAVFAAFASVWNRHEFWDAFRTWFTIDALGMTVAVPAFVAIFRTKFRQTLSARTSFLYPLLLAGLLALLTHQHRVPLMAVVFPLLILIQLRLGLGWAAIGVLLVAGAGSIGVFRTETTPAPRGAALMGSAQLQLFLASAMFMAYSLSLVVDRLQSTKQRLEQIVALHELVTENSRDIILVVDYAGVPRYISPAVYPITGWRPDETMERGFAEVAHLEDLPKVQALAQKLREGTAESGMVEFRVSRRSGGYVWVEGSLRTIRTPAKNARADMLLIVRDISERKRAEEELQAAYHSLEKLAVVDPLTGLANRRRFDECLLTEWRRGLRERQPLSMVLIDVDFFKLYNDTYGHVRGDGCLKQISESAMDVVTRPGDLVARIGGEEFAIVLPNTDQEGAAVIANEVRVAVDGRNLRHQASPYGRVTISAGYAAIIPQLGLHASDLIESADRAMYLAKRRGRNRVATNGEQGSVNRDQGRGREDRPGSIATAG